MREMVLFCDLAIITGPFGAALAVKYTSPAPSPEVRSVSVRESMCKEGSGMGLVYNLEFGFSGHSL